MLLSSYCLDGKIDEMFNLWTMIFEDLHLNDAHRFALSVIERLRSWKPLGALQERVVGTVKSALHLQLFQ